MNNLEKGTQLPKTQVSAQQSIEKDELKEDELNGISGGCTLVPWGDLVRWRWPRTPR